MDTFSVRDLRERTGELIHDAEAGKLSLITKHGRPVFLAIPFTDDLIELGLRPALAVHLYKEGVLTLAKAAKLSGESLEGFIAALSKLGISIVHYTIKDVNEELKDFE
ncbi:MAG: type II toxin-antitoxin system prevent-host-death family antitoxin [Coxiellaceae bacterium]|nr:type II toxin-antitoxin system prevent-host-death family antitoxin [Coxiellaceae bacterium]